MARAERRPIGAVTLGQTPRDDVVPHLEKTLGDRFEILQVGALDHSSEEEVRAGASELNGALLVTRLRGGVEVCVREGFLTPRVQACVSGLQDRAELILFLCTGDFPSLKSSLPILYPGPILRSVVRGLEWERLGVMTPAAEQIQPQRERWGEVTEHAVVEHASPYRPLHELDAAAERLRQAGVHGVAMDCIGYTQRMKQRVRDIVGRPCLTATTLLARVAAEFVD